LLNNWAYFKEEAPFMSEGVFLSRLNREKQAESKYMTRGIKFEEAVMTPGKYLEEGYPENVLAEFQRLTQGAFWQVPIYFELTIPGTSQRARIGGYIDAIPPGNLAYDIKTTKLYMPDAFRTKWQHKLYLIGLDLYGARIDRFEYLVTDFKDYFIEGYDYMPELWKAELYNELIDFHQYVQTNKHRISQEALYVSSSK